MLIKKPKCPKSKGICYVYQCLLNSTAGKIKENVQISLTQSISSSRTEVFFSPPPILLFCAFNLDALNLEKLS